MYSTEQIVDNEYILSYRYYSGNKNKTLFLFHGFGQSNKIFDAFANSLCSDYSVISIDLFFHGESYITTNKVESISIERWNALFDLILEKHQIGRFSLLSYSIGSRFIVSLLKLNAARIDKIVFIAPDGFGNNFWFRVATFTAFTRFIFKHTMQKPTWIRAVGGFCGSVGIVNLITTRFIERNLESADHRKKIYKSWVSFSKLTITSADFVELIQHNDIRFLCFCGREDQLVAKDAIRILCDQTAACYIELDLAHHKMIQVLDMHELNDFLISDR